MSETASPAGAFDAAIIEGQRQALELAVHGAPLAASAMPWIGVEGGV